MIEQTNTNNYLERSLDLHRRFQHLESLKSFSSLENIEEVKYGQLLKRFKQILNDIINDSLSKEGSQFEIQRFSSDFKYMVLLLLEFFLENGQIFLSEEINEFESFLKFYLIRTNFKYINFFLNYLYEKMKPYFSISKPEKEYLMNLEALMRVFQILTSFNSFSEERCHFILKKEFDGFYVENSFKTRMDYKEKSFLANKEIYLNLHIKEDFAIFIQFNPSKNEKNQKLLSFRNKIKEINPNWGWNIEIEKQYIFFVILKPGEPDQKKKIIKEKHLIFENYNEALFFDNWNFFIFSCKNSIQNKYSELTFCLNNQKKSVKIKMDRDLFFHEFKKVKNPENENEQSVNLVPQMSVFHLLNDFWICENFEGKLLQCVVFQENFEFNEIDKILNLFEGVNDTGTFDFVNKLRNLFSQTIKSEIIFEMNAFDFKSSHLNINSSINNLIQNRINFLLNNKSSKIENISSKCKLDLDLSVLRESSQLTEILFSPVHFFKPNEENSKKQILPFEFCFSLFINDPFEFDFSLFQQDFFSPFLLIYKRIKNISSENKDHKSLIEEKFIKTVINFISKPNLTDSSNSEFINKKFEELLSTFLYVNFENGKKEFMNEQIMKLFLDIIPSLDLEISCKLLNDFLLNRLFLFELSSQFKESKNLVSLFFENLSIFTKKYKKIREVVNWQQIIDNFLFFLAISDFSEKPNDQQPHFIMARYLSSYFMLFFPFKMCENECLILFFQDLKLANYFIPLQRSLDNEELLSNEDQNVWMSKDNQSSINLFHELNPILIKHNLIHIDLKMLMNQLTSPLLIKSIAKTSLLLDLIFLLIQNHSCEEFKNEFLECFILLIYDYKNNNCIILTRAIALFLKSGFSFSNDKIIPNSFFDVKKFKPKQNASYEFFNINNFINDSSYIFISCSILIEYLFSLFFENYSLTGFFDHEKLLISNPSVFKFFLSIMKYFDIQSLEKSLQIFGILLKKIKKNQFKYFNNENFFITILDILYKFSNGEGDPFRLKLKMFQFLKQKNPNCNINKIEFLKIQNLHELILKYEINSVEYKDFEANFLNKKNSNNVVSDLANKIIDSLNHVIINENDDLMTLTYNALLSSIYFERFESWDLVISNEIKYLKKFEEFVFKSKHQKSFDSVNICLYIHSLILKNIKLNFFSTSKFIHKSFIDSFTIIKRNLSIIEHLFLNEIDLNSLDFLYKKNKFKVISNDKRFPLNDSSKILSFNQFSFFHFLAEKTEIKNKEKKQTESREIYLENLFFYSNILLNTISKSNSLVRIVKTNVTVDQLDQVNRQIILSLLLLSKQLQIFLFLSRHQTFIKKKVKFKENFKIVFFSTIMSILETISLIDQWNITQHILFEPFFIISQPKIKDLKNLKEISKKFHQNYSLFYMKEKGSFENDELLNRLSSQICFHFIKENQDEEEEILMNSDIFFVEKLENIKIQQQIELEQKYQSMKNISTTNSNSSSNKKESLFSLFKKGFRRDKNIFKSSSWEKDSVYAKINQEFVKLNKKDVSFLEKKHILEKVILNQIEKEEKKESVIKEESTNYSNFDFMKKLNERFSFYFNELESEILNKSFFENEIHMSDQQNKKKYKSFFNTLTTSNNKVIDENNTKKRNEKSIEQYQQILGTISFGFEKELLKFYRIHYKLAKKYFYTGNKFSIVPEDQNILHHLVFSSLNQNFKKYRQQENGKNTSMKDNSNITEINEEIYFEEEKLKNYKRKESIYDFKKSKEVQIITKSMKDISNFSKHRFSNIYKSEILDFPNSLNNISLTEIQTLNPILFIKQHSSTSSSFQKPFVKTKINFSSVSNIFIYKGLLDKKERYQQSKDFLDHYRIIHKINSYLKAFYEMNKINISNNILDDELRKKPKTKRMRKSLLQSKKLPFSSVHFYCQIKNLKFFNCYFVNFLVSMPTFAYIENDDLVLVFTDIMTKRKMFLELKQMKFKFHKGFMKIVNLKNVVYVLEYKFLHNSNGCQIIFKNNHSIILSFKEKKSRNKFLKEVSSISLFWKFSKNFSFKEELKKSYIKELWAYSNRISNFRFLTWLNLFSSRSLNDYSQYPVFPIVVNKIDEQEVKFRDLSKPIGMIGEDCKVDILSNKYVKSDNFDEIPPYFYGSHYSSPATTFHFLLRMKPFDKGAKSIQNGKFDLPDRLFHSITNVLDNINKETSDVRELPPELYYQPLFLINLNDLDFGINQSEERVDHVLTPAILGKGPYRFVYKMRQFLESETVSQNLSNWVDLVFGYKQRGKQAIEAKNVFFYLTYEGSLDKINNSDPKEKEAFQTQVFHFGQIPFQLSKKEWPKKICNHLSVINKKCTKKYFVKKNFTDKLWNINYTCEYCYEKAEDKNFCAECHLCRNCSSKNIPKILKRKNLNEFKKLSNLYKKKSSRKKSLLNSSHISNLTDLTLSSSLYVDDANVLPVEKRCEFCLNKELVENYKRSVSNSCFESSIILIKEENSMELNKKYVSKFTILRPFKVEYYSFVLFKKENNVYSSSKNVSTKPDLFNQSEIQKDEQNLAESGIQEKKNIKTDSAPFDLNMIKSISIEKLQIEMKKLNIKGVRSGLWTLKNVVDLYKDYLVIGGSTNILIYSIKKQKIILNEKLHEYTINQICITKCGKLISADESNIIKLSKLKLNEKNLISLRVDLLNTYFNNFNNKSIKRMMKFDSEQSQYLITSNTLQLHHQIEIFDTDNNFEKVVEIFLDKFSEENHNFVIEFVDISFGYLNCILVVKKDQETNQYYISTYSFEGLLLTQFSLSTNSDEDNLTCFTIFKDSLFKDYLCSLNKKGDIYFFDLPFIENVKKISSKVSLNPQNISFVSQSKALFIGDSEGLVHFYTILPSA